jgi:hypothetical protein
MSENMETVGENTETVGENMETVGENMETVNGTVALTNVNANTSTVIASPPVKTCKFRLIVSIQSYYLTGYTMVEMHRNPYSKLEYTMDSIEYQFDKTNFGKNFGILLQNINDQPSDTKIFINTIECMNVSNYQPKSNIEWNNESKTKNNLSEETKDKFKEKDFVFKFNNNNFEIIDTDITKLLKESDGYIYNSLRYLMNYRFLLDIQGKKIPIILSSTYSDTYRDSDLTMGKQMQYKHPDDPTKNVYIRDNIISATLPPVSTGGRKRKTKKHHKKRKTTKK